MDNINIYKDDSVIRPYLEKDFKFPGVGYKGTGLILLKGVNRDV